jgi:hypothetical protein
MRGYDRNLPPIGGLGSLATTCFKCHLSRARLVRDGREKEQTLNEEVAGPVAVIQERTASTRPKNDPYLRRLQADFFGTASAAVIA